MNGVRLPHRTGSIWVTLGGSPWATVDTPISLHELRRHCRIRAATLSSTLHALIEQGLVLKSAAGYTLPTPR
jgi:DNA-binding HxlR family transcriptional regulator